MMMMMMMTSRCSQLRALPGIYRLVNRVERHATDARQVVNATYIEKHPDDIDDGGDDDIYDA